MGRKSCWWSETLSSSQAPPGFQAQAQNRMQAPIEKKMSMKEIFMQFIQTQQSSIRNLENQLGELASALNNHPPGRLLSNTKKPRMEEIKECKVVELGSGRKLSNAYKNQKPDATKEK